MADRVLRMLLGILVGAWVARHLGPDRFGALAYVLALVSFFQTATSLGMDLVLMRELVKDPPRAPLLLGSSLRLRVMASAIGWVVACVAITLLRPGDTEGLLLTALVAAGLVLQPADLLDLWFQSRSQNHRAVIPRIASFLLISIVRVALILLHAPLWMFAATYVAEATVAAAFLTLSYRQLRTALPWRWHSATAWDLVKRAWPFLASALSVIVYLRVGQIMLRSIAGDRELGLYSAILPFSQAWSFVPAAVCASVMPFLVRLHTDSPVQFRKRFEDLFASLFWSALVISALVAYVSENLVLILLGTQYAGSATALSVHVFSNIPVFLGVAQVAYLTIVGRTRVILVQTVVGLTVSIALNAALIPRFGAMGAAVASVVAYSISAIFCNAFLVRELFIMQILSWARIHVR